MTKRTKAATTHSTWPFQVESKTKAVKRGCMVGHEWRCTAKAEESWWGTHAKTGVQAPPIGGNKQVFIRHTPLCKSKTDTVDLMSGFVFEDYVWRYQLHIWREGKKPEKIEFSQIFMSSIVFSEFNGVYRILIWMTIIAWKGCHKTGFEKRLCGLFQDVKGQHWFSRVCSQMWNFHSVGVYLTVSDWAGYLILLSELFIGC